MLGKRVLLILLLVLQFHMKQFTEMIIKKMKDEKLFASQGGPIILAQIENEYNNVQLAYKSLGTRYVEWAGNMAVGMKTGVPWVMCKQKDAPDPVVSSYSLAVTLLEDWGNDD